MVRRPLSPFAMVVAASFIACAASTPGADPHDMSAAQHITMADTAEQERGSAVARAGACWTTTAHPTAAQLADAREHARMAADHRAASQALRDAEAQSCAGLSIDDRDESPFAHHEDITSVEPLVVGASTSRGQNARVVGATITFRALPGLTQQWLQRVIDCHLARNAVLGHDNAAMADCPLVPRGVSAQVRGTSSGFAVEIRSDDSATAQEILRRARASGGSASGSPGPR